MEEPKKANQLVQKAVDGLFKFKSYWKKPPKGYQVSYREVLMFTLGSGAPGILNIMITQTTLATSVHLMISYFRMSTGMAWILSIFAAIIAIIRSPILSMLIDNSNSDRGKFKPFLMWSSIGSAVCFAFIPYIPNAWNDTVLFDMTLPAIPIMGVHEASDIQFSLAIVLAFVLIQAGLFFNTLLNQCVMGLEQTISTVAQERANISAFRNLLGNLPNSVINIFVPILAGTVFAKMGGWNAVELYRLIFPICGILGVLFVMFISKNVEERVVVNQKYVAKVTFWQGVKLLSKSKYFWIINIVTVASFVRNLSNITTWITQYSFASDSAKTWVGLYCSTLLMNAIAVALIIAPFLIKKMGKRNVFILATVVHAAMIALQLVFYKNPVMILIVSFFQQLCGGFWFVTGIMTSDVLDDLQMKTGKRLEGFWQNYSSIFTTIAVVFTGMLTPLFLSFGNIGFSDNLSVVLQDETLRNGAFFYQSLLAFIGGAIMVIPVFFYDLTEEKHANIVRVLKIRAAAQNFNDNQLQDTDVLNVKEILDFMQENQPEIVKEELAKYDCIDEIVSDYEAVQERVNAAEQKELDDEFERNLELENKRFESKLAKARIKAEQNNEVFDEELFTKSFIENSRFMKEKFEKESISKE